MILIGVFLMSLSFIIYNYVWIVDLKLLKTPSWYSDRFSDILFWLNFVLLVIGIIICFLHNIWVGVLAVAIYFFVAPSVISPIIYRIFPKAKSSSKLPVWPIPKRTVADRIRLFPKKGIGPDSSLKEFPLLYLYFDDFSEITKAWQEGSFEAARHDSNIRSKEFSLDKIMKDENLFLDLYKRNLLRLKLNDSTDLRRDSEEDYWDRVIHPEKYLEKIPFSPTLSDKTRQEISAEIKRLDKLIEVKVNAIKLRYGL